MGAVPRFTGRSRTSRLRYSAIFILAIVMLSLDLILNGGRVSNSPSMGMVRPSLPRGSNVVLGPSARGGQQQEEQALGLVGRTFQPVEITAMNWVMYIRIQKTASETLVRILKNVSAICD